MTRFASTQAVREFALRAARDDIRRHIADGNDLNPFSTDGARHCWKLGFDNSPTNGYDTDPAWDSIYQRGRACAELLKGSTS